MRQLCKYFFFCPFPSWLVKQPWVQEAIYKDRPLPCELNCISLAGDAVQLKVLLRQKYMAFVKNTSGRWGQICPRLKCVPTCVRLMSLWLLGRWKGNQGGSYHTLWYPADDKWQLVRQMAQSANIDGNYKVIIQHWCHMENKQRAIHLVLHLEMDEPLRCHLHRWPEREREREWEPRNISLKILWIVSQKTKKEK